MSNIKAIRMKYRQKALPDRGAQWENSVQSIQMTMDDCLEAIRRSYGNGSTFNRNQRLLFPDLEHLHQRAMRCRLPGDLTVLIPIAVEFHDDAQSEFSIGVRYHLNDLEDHIQEAQRLVQISNLGNPMDSPIVDIAQNILDTNNWGITPILADALEESGCTDRHLLQLLRERDENSNRLQYAVRQIAGGV